MLLGIVPRLWRRFETPWGRFDDIFYGEGMRIEFFLWGCCSEIGEEGERERRCLWRNMGSIESVFL